VEGSGNNLVLLCLCELVEVYGIAGNAHSELRIFFRMSLSVQKSLFGKYIYI
jgi:hypothetical protein